MTCYIPRWFTRLKTVIHPSTNPTVHGRNSNSRPVDHESDTLTTTCSLQCTLPSHNGISGGSSDSITATYIASHNYFFLGGGNFWKTKWGSCLRYFGCRKMVGVRTVFVRFFRSRKHKFCQCHAQFCSLL